jgi:predicted nucleic acid-binding protein
VILLDANILLYASDTSAPENVVVATWTKQLFAGTETIALPWVVLWAFLRVSTNPSLFKRAKAVP